MVSKMPKNVDWSKLSEYEQKDFTVASQELACSAGVCEVVDLPAALSEVDIACNECSATYQLKFDLNTSRYTILCCPFVVEKTLIWKIMMKTKVGIDYNDISCNLCG